MDERVHIRAGSTIVDAIQSLARPPFRLLLLVTVLASVAAESLGDVTGKVSQGDLLVALGLLAAQLYIQIAIALAAGSSDPTPSSEAWVRAAWKRRCFWRFVLTGVLVAVIVIVGALAFVVGAFVAAAIVGLGQPAVVLERITPFAAIARSAELSKPARPVIGVVFGLLLIVPTLGIEAGTLLEWPDALGAGWTAVGIVAEALSTAGLIALTRLFVVLGGAPTPAMDAIAPVQRKPPP